MKKLLTSSIFFAIIFFFMVLGQNVVKADEITAVQQVIEPSLPVYLDTSDESSISGYLTIGDFVTTVNEQGNWTNVRSNELEGFVLSSGLMKVQPTKYLIDKKDGTDLFTYPSPNAQINGRLYSKSIVNVYGSAPGGWSFVQYGYQFGYVATNSLKVPVATNKRVNAKSGATLYAIASDSADVISKIAHETVVQQYTAFAGWAYVEAGEIKGYIKAAELSNPVTLGNKVYNKGIPAEKGATKRVALTFDDGPDEKVTPQILAILKKYDAKATFFMVGKNASKNPEIVKQIYEEGHEIGNHTWNHPQLTNLKRASVKQEVDRTSNAIYEAIGQYPTVFRPPYGATNGNVRSVISMPSILWSVDTLDWKHRNASKLLSSVKASVKDGSIILMHDIHQSTANGLESVLLYLQQQDYEFVTVSEILQ